MAQRFWPGEDAVGKTIMIGIDLGIGLRRSDVHEKQQNRTGHCEMASDVGHRLIEINDTRLLFAIGGY